MKGITLLPIVLVLIIGFGFLLPALLIRDNVTDAEVLAVCPYVGEVRSLGELKDVYRTLVDNPGMLLVTRVIAVEQVEDRTFTVTGYTLFAVPLRTALIDCKTNGQLVSMDLTASALPHP